jgi:cysteine desulfurase
MQKRVYLDHNATAPHAENLKSRWNELIDLSGNPSSIHQDSRAPKTHLRETRQIISQYLNSSPLEVIFNSGASEGNNSVLKSIWVLLGSRKPEIIISAVEHPSVMNTAKYLQSLGATIHVVPVSREGEFDFNFFKAKLSEKTALVSVMFANNETGTIFPIAEIAKLAHAAGALMHSDCVQLLGKNLTSFASLDVDYATFSGHKFYSLKGTGFTYVKKNSPWVSLIHGGGQERGRRGGTENLTGIAALGIVFENIQFAHESVQRMQKLRDLMEENILKNISAVTVTAQKQNRLSNTSSLVIDHVDGETLLMSLDLKGFAVSTGAACSSGNPEPSPVLLAIGLSRDEAQSSLRISLGWSTSEENIQDFVLTLTQVVYKLREINQNEKTGSYDR